MISSDYRTHSEAIGRLSPRLGTRTEWEYCLSCCWGTSHRQLEDTGVAKLKAKITIGPSEQSWKETECQHEQNAPANTHSTMNLYEATRHLLQGQIFKVISVANSQLNHYGLDISPLKKKKIKTTETSMQHLSESGWTCTQCSPDRQDGTSVGEHEERMFYNRNWWEKLDYPRRWLFPLFNQGAKMHSSWSGWLSHGWLQSRLLLQWVLGEGRRSITGLKTLPFCADSDQWPLEKPVKQRALTYHGQAVSTHPCGTRTVAALPRLWRRSHDGAFLPGSLLDTTVFNTKNNSAVYIWAGNHHSQQWQPAESPERVWSLLTPAEIWRVIRTERAAAFRLHREARSVLQGATKSRGHPAPSHRPC